MLNEVAEQIQHCCSHLRIKKKKGINIIQHGVQMESSATSTKSENSITDLGVLFSDLALQISSSFTIMRFIGLVLKRSLRLYDSSDFFRFSCSIKCDWHAEFNNVELCCMGMLKPSALG